MKVNLEKLFEIARPMTSKEKADLEYFRGNSPWLCLSGTFALKLRQILRLKNISKEELASRMSVSVPEIEHYLSGKFNFDIKIIAKFQRVLEEPIIEIDLLSKLSGCDKLSEEQQKEGNNNLD